jgi:hypothetical protein
MSTCIQLSTAYPLDSSAIGAGSQGVLQMSILHTIFHNAFRCPVDNYVFPGLDRSRAGDGLEARFNAFKIPESNFLVFEATVRTCRDGCQPVSSASLILNIVAQ